MRANDGTIRFASGALGEHRHICAFFNGADDEHATLRSFIKDGLDAGDKAFHIVDPALRDDYLRRLVEAGVDVENALATGQLEVAPWQDAYLRGDRFEQEEMLALVEKVLQANAASGYPHTRIIGHMEWALLDRPGVGDLLEYETRVNYFLPRYDDPVICAYDVSKFGAAVAMDILRTHPMVILGGVLQKNPFFVPPNQLLSEIRERQVGRKWRDARELLRTGSPELWRAIQATHLGELAASVVHEISQPLAAIGLNAAAAITGLARSEPDVSLAREALRDIVVDGQRAGDVVHRIRQLMMKHDSTSDSSP
jgi:signal transduction histidine kinase